MTATSTRRLLPALLILTVTMLVGALVSPAPADAHAGSSSHSHGAGWCHTSYNRVDVERGYWYASTSGGTFSSGERCNGVRVVIQLGSSASTFGGGVDMYDSQGRLDAGPGTGCGNGTWVYGRTEYDGFVARGVYKDVSQARRGCSAHMAWSSGRSDANTGLPFKL